MFKLVNIMPDLITTKTCRTCLKNDGSIPMFEKRENNKTLAEMLVYLTTKTVRTSFDISH